jgi:hypothetical protein
MFVRDIRTARALSYTHDLTEVFTLQVQMLLENGESFYMVHGRCRLKTARRLIDNMKSLDTFPVIYDKQMPSDRVYLFSGAPDELGFMIAS